MYFNAQHKVNLHMYHTLRFIKLESADPDMGLMIKITVGSDWWYPSYLNHWDIYDFEVYGIIVKF